MRDVTHTMLNVEKHKINWDWGGWGECYNKHHIFHIMIEFGSGMMGGQVEDIMKADLGQMPSVEVGSRLEYNTLVNNNLTLRTNTNQYSS